MRRIPKAGDAFGGVVGAKPMPLGEPCVLMRSVKTHKGLLLEKVTKPSLAIRLLKRTDTRRVSISALLSQIRPYGVALRVSLRSQSPRAGKKKSGVINSTFFSVHKLRQEL